MKKFRSFPYFWTVYALLILLFVGGVAVGLRYLTDYLHSFEASQPIHEAQRVFDRYFAQGDFLEAVRLADLPLSEFETEEAPAELLRQMKEGKELAFYSIPCKEGEAQYNVVLIDPGQTPPATEAIPATKPSQTTETVETEEPITGFLPLSHRVAAVGETSGEPGVVGIPSTKIATIYLVQGTEKDAWGYTRYEFSHLQLYLKAKEQVAVTIPSHSSLQLNGVAVERKYITESKDHIFNDFLSQGVPGFQMERYEVDGLYLPPVLASTDRDQVPHRLEQEEEDGSYTALLNYSTNLQQQYADFIMQGMKQFAMHIQRDANFATVIPYFDPQSEFYRHIYENPGQWVTGHNGFSFQEEYIGEFYSLDENTFCCRVSFDQHLHRNGQPDYVDPLDMMVFVHRVGDRFLIYDRYNVN